VPAAFEMSGRLSVRQGDRGDIARLRWTHRPGADAWIVSSPVGNEVARIESDAQGAVLTRAGEAPERSASFEALTLRLFGAALGPLSLSAWLHGRAAPDAGSGWQVAIEETQRAGAIEMARRITASREDIVVKLVVDAYRVLED
jgi:outer membrane lipoprotein LolB